MDTVGLTGEDEVWVTPELSGSCYCVALGTVLLDATLPPSLVCMPPPLNTVNGMGLRVIIYIKKMMDF